MQITKLIIPLLGLTTINNNANSQANSMQVEKELSLNMPYEILVESNQDNYLATENLIQNEVIQLNIQGNEVGGLRPIANAGCEDVCYNVYVAACTACSAGFVFPPAYAVCMAAAFSAYGVCLAACRG